MPKRKNPLTPDQQRKLFEEEVRRQKEAGNLDADAAESALDKLVRKSAKPR